MVGLGSLVLAIEDGATEENGDCVVGGDRASGGVGATSLGCVLVLAVEGELRNQLWSTTVPGLSMGTRQPW